MRLNLSHLKYPKPSRRSSYLRCVDLLIQHSRKTTGHDLSVENTLITKKKKKKKKTTRPTFYLLKPYQNKYKTQLKAINCVKNLLPRIASCTKDTFLGKK
ncbi:hypothetical protein Hanom_Chr12g01116351 [Helianthus anomalus]